MEVISAIILSVTPLVSIFVILYIRELRKNVEEEKQENYIFKKELKKEKSEHNKLKDEYDRLDSNLKGKNWENHELKKKLRKEISEHENLKKVHANLKTANENNWIEKHKIEKIVEKEHSENESLKKELFKLKETIEYYQKEEKRRLAERAEKERRRREEERRLTEQAEKERIREEEERRLIKQAEEERKKKEEEKRRLAEQAEKEQKKKEREEKKQLALEYRKKKEEEKKAFLNQLQLKFQAIGAKIKYYYDETGAVCKITAKEDIVVDKLFPLLQSNYRCKFDCNINNLENKKLLNITFERSEIILTDENEERVFNKGNYKQQAKDFLFCYLENRKIKRLENSLASIIKDGINKISKLSVKGDSIKEKICSVLTASEYDFIFKKQIECSVESDMLIVDYEFPNTSAFSEVKEYKYSNSSKEISIKKYPESYIAKRYESALYSITLRSLYEIFSVDKQKKIQSVTFNGFVTQINPATGITEQKCILSIQVDRTKFSQINISQVDPKACFKTLKGVSAAKLIDISPITPILTFNKKDKRFIEGKDVDVSQGTNLAAMHWEDFEQLVRGLFELEFAKNGGEVRVTQASRDGGVDAIIFDPDPLRGGKIVIQAKRYTNTVGVSAVRDLYGTVINEGANTGILITTSDYGHDSYEFAKDKPLKLLNGGHLLALLHKNGRKAHINIEEAKKINENNTKEKLYS